jgi:hypothetical protein
MNLPFSIISHTNLSLANMIVVGDCLEKSICQLARYSFANGCP